MSLSHLVSIPLRLAVHTSLGVSANPTPSPCALISSLMTVTGVRVFEAPIHGQRAPHAMNNNRHRTLYVLHGWPGIDSRALQ